MVTKKKKAPSRGLPPRKVVARPRKVKGPSELDQLRAQVEALTRKLSGGITLGETVAVLKSYAEAPGPIDLSALKPLTPPPLVYHEDMRDPRAREAFRAAYYEKYPPATPPITAEEARAKASVPAGMLVEDRFEKGVDMSSSQRTAMAVRDAENNVLRAERSRAEFAENKCRELMAQVKEMQTELHRVNAALIARGPPP